MDTPSEDIIRWTYVDISRAADATTETSALMAWDDGWQHRVSAVASPRQAQDAS